MISEYEGLSPGTALGAKVEEFRTENWSQLLRGCIGLFCLSIGALIVIVQVMDAFKGELRLTKAGLVVTMMLLVAGVGLLRGIREAARVRVELFSEGLILREGSIVVSCFWKEILVVLEKEATHQQQRELESIASIARAFVLRLSSGRTIVLKSYLRDLERLGAAIQRGTLPHLLPQYQSALCAGRDAEFGSIRLVYAGIEVAKKTLPWSELGRIVRDGGWLKIKKRGAWFAWKKVRLNEVPNAHVLQEIVSQRFHPQHVS
jgi:hypothetical protein